MSRILTQQSAAGMRIRSGVLAAFGLVALFVCGTSLKAASPELNSTSPRGGKRGSEVVVKFQGNRLSDMQEVMFHHPGIKWKDLKNIDAKNVEATLVIAPDCRLGEHHVRLRGKDGTTYARTFWISQFDTVAEVEPNDLIEAPQEIPLNVTVEGGTKPEETDFYKIQAKKGERISVEVEALRLNFIRQRVAIDPAVAIYDKDGKELAVNDDSALLKQESVLSIIAPEDGTYFVEIRDAAFQGNGAYRAHIGSYPRPLAVYPAGGKIGQEIEFKLIGDQKGNYAQKVKLPAEPDENFPIFGSNDGLLPPSPNRVRVVSFDNVMEVEPNDLSTDLKEAASPALPLAFNGILGKEGDNDYFKFSAKKGQKFRFRSYANQLGTPVDTVIYVYDSKMKQLGSSDDADGSADSRYDFSAAADGDYFLRVRDHLNRGGDDFVYRVETESNQPEVTVTMPEMIRRDMQYRKQFDIPRGNSFAMNVNTARRNFSGDLVFDLPELPEGVTWEAGTIPKNLSQFPIVFHAKKDAPIAGKMVPLYVKNAGGDVAVRGKFNHMLDFVRGNPNGTPYYTSYHDEFPVAVIEEVPFSLSIDTPKVPLVRDGTMKLKVRLKRAEGFDKKVVVRMLWRPPGIGCPSTVTIPEKATEIDYELNANANAEIANWKITMLAEADAGSGMVTTAAPFAEVRVEEPFVGMKITMATAKAGEKTELICELDQLRDFPGEAEVQLFGLPAKATAETLKITQDMTELRIPVSTDVTTPVAQHKGLFCTVTVVDQGQPIQHRVGMGGILRVDPKPKEPAKPKPADAAKMTKKEEPKKEKPLSRLEQLRLEAKAAAEAEAQ